MSTTLIVQWSSFGPFHIARLNAAFKELQPAGIVVMGMEITPRKEKFVWEQMKEPTAFQRCVAVPGKAYERASPVEMWHGVMSVLDRVNPDAVAINGYSNHDAWSALTWCKLYRRPAILMSDSRWEDAPRVTWKEWVKQRIVREYDSALCAGQPQRSYLERLGLGSKRIFEGLDAIDNEFFWRGAEQSRKNPDLYRSLPGLQTPGPFFLASARFVKGKNLDGLLRGYARYRQKLVTASGGRAPWRLVILGDGIERRAIEAQIKAEDIRGVSLPGVRQIDELPVYYGLADVFIHPTYQDTWGLVVNEAMAAGLPVLVSRGSGCALDLVHEGENGFTFVPENAETLADLMVLMSSAQLDLKAMGQASRDLISQWGPKRFAQGLFGAMQAAIH